MEVHFAPDTEKRLNEIAMQSGDGSAEQLVQNVVEGYFQEMSQVREMLDGRYDDLKSGRVKPIPGEEVEAYFRDKSAAVRKLQPRS
jgi:hypothetical protein